MTSDCCLTQDNINKPVPYLVPMSERSSLSVSSSLEAANIRAMKASQANVIKSLFNAKDNASDILDKIAFAGMSLWFLTLGVLICVVLFSKTGRARQ